MPEMNDVYINDVYEIPVRSLIRVVGNPMTTHSWQNKPFTASHVKKFVKSNKLDHRPWDGGPKEENPIQNEGVETNEYHIARVAYMVVNPQEHPICLEFDGAFCNIVDGNHRFAT
ncbi:MAG: hypothetical protein HC836_10575 [Richelia sp. RM2_1_2]|nr:hypothetical protein [Richelia sp. RM2_1_2]